MVVSSRLARTGGDERKMPAGIREGLTQLPAELVGAPRLQLGHTVWRADGTDSRSRARLCVHACAVWGSLVLDCRGASSCQSPAECRRSCCGAAAVVVVAAALLSSSLSCRCNRKLVTQGFLLTLALLPSLSLFACVCVSVCV